MALQTVFHFLLLEIAWVFVMAFGVVLVWRKKSGTLFAPHLFLFALALCFAGLGLARTEFASRSFNVSPLESSLNQPTELTGVVVREPEMRETSLHLYVQVEEDLLLVTTDRHSNVSYGDEVSVKGKLERPKAFTTDLGREFNYPGYLLARGVEYKIPFAKVEVLSNDQGYRIISFLLVQKKRLMSGIESVLNEPQAGLGEGLLLGVKQALGKDLEADFRKTGIIHIVVLSGYNVMLVVAFVMFILSFLVPKRVRLVAGLLAIVAFALIVGLSATVVRAGVMAGLILIAQAYGRTYDMLRALLFAGVVMICINPFLLLYDIGFQFSFMATLGLVLIAPQFENLLTEGFKKIRFKEFLIATIATQIAVLPLLLYYIGEVSLIAVVVNVLVLPVVPLAMLATFVAGLGALVSIPLALPFAFLAHGVLSYIVAVATFFADIPFASVFVPTFTLLWVFILYTVIGATFMWFSRHRDKSKSEVSDWTIEEEKEMPGRATSALPGQAEPPIFFR